MAISTGSIQDWIYDSVEDIPTNISGTHIKDLVERGKRFVQNWTGDTITSSNVEEKYQTVLTNLGCAYLHSQMAGVGVDFDARVGEFSVKKGGGKDNVNTNRADWYVNQVNAELQSIGRKAGNRFKRVYG